MGEESWGVKVTHRQTERDERKEGQRFRGSEGQRVRGSEVQVRSSDGMPRKTVSRHMGHL
jgi:hypothetical protein